jgi:hypothetical protein
MVAQQVGRDAVQPRAGIGAVHIEARPHPECLGERRCAHVVTLAAEATDAVRVDGAVVRLEDGGERVGARDRRSDHLTVMPHIPLLPRTTGAVRDPFPAHPEMDGSVGPMGGNVG